MFKETTHFDFDTLEKRLREESFLNGGPAHHPAG